MENIIYRLDDSQETKLDIMVVSTNEVEPYREIKELGICVFNEDTQLDFSLKESEIRSLVRFLNDSLEYVKHFNETSKPKP